VNQMASSTRWQNSGELGKLQSLLTHYKKRAPLSK
jgi:hypothetical protein